MLLLKPRTDSEHLIALFGLGLIGSAVAAYLSTSTNIVTVPWAWSGAIQNNPKQLSRSVKNLTEANKITRFSSIWCAGQAGFSATQTHSELANFELVLAWFRQLQKQYPRARFDFHLTSSTGGLFENQQGINSQSKPQALRPYGDLKLAQEALLSSCSWLHGRYIYRPTSVYGYSGPGQRMGLIPTLISNGFKNAVSTIYGHLDTLRDYVFNGDIGRFIAERVLAENLIKTPQTYLLGTARPASIFEIRQLIERRIQRKIYLQFRPNTSANTGNITLNPNALPDNWQALSLESGIEKVYRQLITGQSFFEQKEVNAYG